MERIHAFYDHVTLSYASKFRFETNSFAREVSQLTR